MMRTRVLLGGGVALVLSLLVPEMASASTNVSATNALSVSAYTCTAVSTIAQTGPASLTTIGTAVCSLPVQQTATSSIGVAVLGTGLATLSSQAASCGSCATISATDTATVLPVSLVTYIGQFRDVITSLPGTTIIPGGGCAQFGAPNQALCVADSTYTFPA